MGEFEVGDRVKLVNPDMLHCSSVVNAPLGAEGVVKENNDGLITVEFTDEDGPFPQMVLSHEVERVA